MEGQLSLKYDLTATESLYAYVIVLHAYNVNIIYCNVSVLL
jgi:hypothetical protein